MKILFLIQSLDKSGAPKSLSLVANHFDMCGHYVTVFTENERIEVKLNNSIHVIKGPEIRKKIFGRFRIIKYINQITKSNRYDVIITFVPLYILALLKSRSLLVFSDRGLDIHRKAFIIYRILAKHCNFVVLQTPFAVHNYPNLKSNQVRVIPNAIQPLDFAVAPYSKRKITEGKISCSGRLFIHQKRQDVMIKAMKLLHEEFPNACLHIYGDGPDRIVLEKMIIEQKAERYIKLEGFSNQVMQDIYDSEIFVLCSDYEGLPNSLIEAMQLGLPCISTDCLPGGAKFLLEGGAGIIVSKGEPELVANGICKLLGDKDLRYQISKKAVERVKEFEYERIMLKWQNLIDFRQDINLI